MASTTHSHSHGHHGPPVDLTYGIVAEFEDSDALLAAATKAREAGFVHLDAYSPVPVHGLTDAIGFRDYKVPIGIFCGGVVGGLTGLALQSWVNMIELPLNIGGRPRFSWPSFIPVTYECTILFASLTAVFGMIALNGLPMPYHPIFNAKNFERASQDRYFLCIEQAEGVDLKEAEKLLKKMNAINVSKVEADEEGKW